MASQPVKILPAKILIVEEDAMVAYALERTLDTWGHQAVGPAAGAGEALKLIAVAQVDAAIVDVSPDRTRTERVAEALADAGIPFLFTTSHAPASVLPDAFLDLPVIAKPYQPERLRQALAHLLTCDRPLAVGP